MKKGSTTATTPTGNPNTTILTGVERKKSDNQNDNEECKYKHKLKYENFSLTQTKF